ncbi:PAS domain S-box protein [Niveibacterium umoris]|uniref:histidine kinase n=1 Tax=Niveibacterium umoris TaxID=1193620 RepID=A0A840BWR2_9RHOO|nr:PAS domain S-box protein [Niveibacterium umoris]MBB4014747.1 PAS domain S-box-containing protein [Niveibacterium umoris]
MQKNGGLIPSAATRRSLMPAFLLALVAASLGIALSVWIWRASVESERTAFEQAFHATAQEVITRMDTDVQGAIGLGRAMAAAIRLHPELSQENWNTLLQDVRVARFEPPLAALMLVELATPEAPDMQVRVSTLVAPDAARMTLGDPWVLRLAQEGAARALRADDVAVGSGGDGRPDGASLLVLAVPVSRTAVLLLFVDARQWLISRAALLSEDAAVRAVELSDAGAGRTIASSAGYPADAEVTEVGVFTQGTQRWAFEVASLSAPPTYLARVNLLFPGVVVSLLLAAVLFTLLARKRLADRVVARVRRDLADSLRRFELAIAASQDGIWEYLPDRRACRLSPQAAQFLGLADGAEFIPPSALLRRVAREDRHALLSALRRSIVKGDALDLECRIRNGAEPRWLRVRANPAAGGAGATVIGALSDISLHKRMAERLKRQQDFLAQVLDVLPVPIIVKDRGGAIHFVNAAFERTLQVTRSAIIGRLTGDIASSVLAARLGELESSLQGLGDTRETRLWIDLPGARRHMRVSRSLFAGPEGGEMLVGSYIDITDEAEATRRQVAFRDYLQRLIDTMPHAFFVKDAHSRFVMVNPAFCELYELPATAVLGKSPREIYDDAAVADAQLAGDRLVLQGGAIRDEELRFRTRGGTQRVTRVHKVSCVDPDGHALITGVVTDVSDLVAAQEGQREVIERLDSLYRNAPFGLALVDEVGRVLQANPTFCKLFGFDEAQLKFRNVDTLSPPDLRRDHRGRFAALLATGRLAPFETRYLDSGGREIDVRVAGAAVAGNSAGYRFAWGIVEDISARVATERALAASEHRWQFALDGAGDGVWDWDVAGGRIFFSTRWKAMLGYAEEEIGDTLDEFTRRLHPDDLHATMEEAQAHIEGRTPMFSREVRMRCKDGRWKWILDRGKVVERDEHGTALRLIGTHSDISRSKEAEAALQRSAALLAAISNLQEAYIRAPESCDAFAGLLRDVLAITASDSGFIGEVQASAEGPMLHALAVAQRGADAALGDPAQDATLGELGSIVGEALRTGELVIENDPARAAAHAGWPAGLPRPQHVLCLPVRYGGQLLGMIGVADREAGYDHAMCSEFDPLLRTFGEIISARRSELARRSAETELAQHRDRLAELVRDQTADLIAAKEVAEAASEAKGMFLANMSHELRTPLHAVISFARLGETKVGRAAEDRLREYFQRISSSGERLLALLNDLLDLAKLEAGRMQIDTRACDLAELVGDALQEFEAWFAAKRLQVGLDVEVRPARAWADPVRFGQVLRNLLSNATKFTAEGHAITLTVAAAHLHGSGGAEVAAIEVRVSDQGVGIPEDELETVFDKFVQSSKTHTGAGGTGLGLAICREIIAAHGGVIFARNNPAGGACFVVRLPAVEELEQE